MHDSIHIDADSNPAVSHFQTGGWNRRVSQQMYANILYLSRAAKLRKWKRHSRSSSLPNLNISEKAASKAVEQAEEPSRSSQRASITAGLPRHIQREMKSSSSWQHGSHDVMTPTILVSSYDSETYNDLHRSGEWSKGWKDVGGIPWVDWVDEYQRLKDAELQRRMSLEVSSNASTSVSSDVASDDPRASFTENDLDTFMEDHNRRNHKSDENFFDRLLIPWWSSVKSNVQQTLHRKRPSGAFAVAPLSQTVATAFNEFPSMTQRRISNLVNNDDSESNAIARHRYQLSLDLHDIRNVFPGHFSNTGGVPGAGVTTATPAATEKQVIERKDHAYTSSPPVLPSPVSIPQRQQLLSNQHPTTSQSSVPSSVGLQRMFSYTPGLAPFSYGSSVSSHGFDSSVSPSLSSHGSPVSEDQKSSSLTAFFGMGGSALSTPEDYAANNQKLDADDKVSPTTIRIRHTIKSRLEYAKKVCDAELRLIIDGLNEYVERGLQYVEDVDEVLEHGVTSPDSDELEEEEAVGHIHEDSPAQTDVQNATDTAIPPTMPTTAAPSPAPAMSRSKRNMQISLHGIDESEEALLAFERSDEDDGSDQEQLKELTEQLKQELQGSSYSEEATISANVHSGLPTVGTLTPSDSVPAHLSHVNSRLTLISEDSYLPTPFILTLQDLISLAQSVLDMPLDTFLENSGTCAELVSRIQALGVKWDENPRWPCREWYVRLLLGVAALNRVVEWWEAERGFWANSFTLSAPKSIPGDDINDGDFDSDRTGDTRRRSSGASSNWSSSYMLPSARGETIIEEQSETEPDDFEEQRSSAMATPLSSGSETIMMNKRSSEQMDVSDVQSDFNDQKNDSDQLQLDAERGQNTTIVMELSLGTVEVRYLSPVWQHVVG